MGNFISNILNSRQVRNAVQEQNGFKSYGSSQLNNYNGFQTEMYTRHYMDSYFSGLNKHGKYDNFYGDYNRIIQVAPTYPFYYVRKDEIVEDGDFLKYLEEPNRDYPQFKVWQQVYSQMITSGYADIFLWRKDGANETQVFKEDKLYKEDDFRGITLVSGYDWNKLTAEQKRNIVRISYGVSQDNVFMGYSPTQAAQSWRKMQDEMGLHMTAFAKNAGMPIGKFIITAPSPEEFAKLRDKLQGKIDGGRNNGKVLYDYRPADSKVSQIEWVQFTSQDVQDYTEQLEFAEKKMSQSFGVSGTVKGTNDGENYATARVSEHIFIKYTIKSLITDFHMQLEHALKQRFDLTGEIKVNIPLPEIADESKVKIEATKLQVELFDQKIAEGFTAQSIVAAYNLPESFLLLEKESDVQSTENSQNKPKKPSKTLNNTHSHANRNELLREYQNALTKEQRERLEEGFSEILQSYAANILEGKYSDNVREDFEGKMVAHFGKEYKDLYDVSLDDVADSLAEVLEVVDVADLKLTDEELEAAANAYNERVKAFSSSFMTVIEGYQGYELDVRSKKVDGHVNMVAVTESEHTRIVSELKVWTKAQEEFPVRVYKTWNARVDACPECRELDDIQIDVTALFINNPTDSIYEVQGGGAHPNCVFGDTEVLASDVNAVTRFAYTGEKINIMTDSGRKLSVTPNHVLMTDRGWVAAKDIKNTDNIVAYGNGVKRNSGAPDIDESHFSIGEVFETLSKSSKMTTKTVPLASVDFHGDATVNEDVDIVFPKSLLRNNRVPSLDEFGDNSFFVGGGDNGVSLNSNSSLRKTSLALLAATDSFMSSVSKSKPFGTTELSHTEDVRLATIAGYNARFAEVSGDASTTNTQALREFKDANPTLIEFDKVSSVEVNFVTHEYVYDLSTFTKLYSANEFVSSNCRCFVRYDMEKADDRN